MTDSVTIHHEHENPNAKRKKGFGIKYRESATMARISTRHALRRRTLPCHHEQCSPDDRTSRFSGRSHPKSKSSSVKMTMSSFKRKGISYIFAVLFILVFAVYIFLFWKMVYIQNLDNNTMHKFNIDNEKVTKIQQIKGSKLVPKSRAHDEMLQHRHVAKVDLDDVIHKRNRERRKRLQPRNFSQFNQTDSKFKSLQKATTYEFGNNHKMTKNEYETDIINFCVGSQIREVFATNSNEERPVVLITSVLSQLGFNLALKLLTQCRVHVVGMDSMYSNDDMHKLELLRRLAILQSYGMSKQFVVSFDGLSPKESEFLDEETGDFNIIDFARPTHVVHIVTENMYNANIQHQDKDDSTSTDDLFEMRQRLVAIEQLMSKLEFSSRVHVTLVNDIAIPNSNLNKKKMYDTIKEMEQVVVNTMAKRSSFLNHTILSLNFPTIYGPVGRAGSLDHDLVEDLLQDFLNGTITDSRTMTDSTEVNLVDETTQLDLLFIDGKLGFTIGFPSVMCLSLFLFSNNEDAIDAIISCMHFRTKNNPVTSFDFRTKGHTTSSAIFYNILKKILQGEITTKEMHTNSSTDKVLNWKPKHSLNGGASKQLSHHFNIHMPYQPLMTQNNSIALNGTLEIEQRLPICEIGDIYCSRGQKPIPCSAECSTNAFCTKSSLDKVAPIAHNLTENCDLVLYTTILEEGITQISFRPPSFDRDDDERLCAFAFVISTSILAKSVKQNASDTQSDTILQYQGWNFVFIDTSDISLSWQERQVFKLTPGNLFHASVKSALYLPRNFSSQPEPDDLRFMFQLLHKPRTLYPLQRVYSKMDRMNFMVESKKKDALVALPGLLKDPIPEIVDIKKGNAPKIREKMHLSDGINSIKMNQRQKVNDGVKRQIDFEKKMKLHFNSRDYIPLKTTPYKFVHEHWIDSNWIVHNLELAEARNFRCDWYLEDIQWENGSDALSFAHIMALDKVNRFHRSNDEVKMEMLEEQATTTIDLTNDQYEWQTIEDRFSKSSKYVRILDKRALIMERELWQTKVDLDRGLL